MDGSKERYNTYKDESVLLSTVLMGKLFEFLMIDAKENIDNVIFDITWVFTTRDTQ